MDWKPEEVEDAKMHGLRADQGVLGGTDAFVEAVMSRTAEILQALGGTMTADGLRQCMVSLKSSLAPLTGEAIEQHVTAQGATVATLQAKVEELEKTANDATAHWKELADGWQADALKTGRERDAARAEVERLKAELTSERDSHEVARTALHRALSDVELATRKANEKHDALLDAESRLAAIRKRANDLDELIERFLWMSGDKEVSGNALQFVARWVLEGDAPNSSTTSNGSGDAPQEARPACVCRLGQNLPCYAVHHPCAPTCTHDDAGTPGHPQRVKERSEAVNRASGVALYGKAADWEAGYKAGAEEARADVEALKAKVASLTAAGQVLSEHVDKAIDGGASPEAPRADASPMALELNLDTSEAEARLARLRRSLEELLSMGEQLGFMLKGLEDSAEHAAVKVRGGAQRASPFQANATMAKDVIGTSPRVRTILCAGERVEAVNMPGLDFLEVFRRDGTGWSVSKSIVILDGPAPG